MALRDVAYVIKALPVVKDGVDDDVAKFRDQFRRRVQRGRCFATPYLGCREFSAFFGQPKGERPIPLNADLGTVLLDIEYDPDRSGRGTPRYFAARLENGILRVPDPAAREAT